MAELEMSYRCRKIQGAWWFSEPFFHLFAPTPRLNLGASPRPPTPKGPNMGFLGHLGPYFGSKMALELSTAAIGFIWTNFQAKWSIPSPVWTHFSFLDFLDPA